MRGNGVSCYNVLLTSWNVRTWRVTHGERQVFFQVEWAVISNITCGLCYHGLSRHHPFRYSSHNEAGIDPASSERPSCRDVFQPYKPSTVVSSQPTDRAPSTTRPSGPSNMPIPVYIGYICCHIANLLFECFSSTIVAPMVRLSC